MSMYEMMFPDEDRIARAETMLRAVGLVADEEPNITCPRFRDAWLEKIDGRYYVHIYARIGGQNRQDYADFWHMVTKHHGFYARDEDDAYDETYASIYFDLSKHFENNNVTWTEEMIKMTDSICEDEPVDTAARWRAAQEMLQNTEYKDLPENLKIFGIELEAFLSDPTKKVMEI